jgi:ABC-type Fe2+-enterobactin transport system substrate-binding protein
MIRKQLTRHTAFERKMELLKNERINTRLWHLPEHKGLYPAEQSTKDIVLLSLDDLLSIQELKHEAQRKLAVVLPTKKKETMIIAWMIRIWKEIILPPGVSYSEAVDAFCAIHNFDVSPDRVKNAIYDMVTKEDHAKVIDEVAEVRHIVDREWRRIKDKKDKTA